MPLLRNKFQPYFPDPDAPNNYQCGSEQYCHPVTVGDTVWTQFYQTPCNENEVQDPEFDDYTLGSELITNGSFAINPAATWSYDPEWTWDAGNTEMDCLNGSGAILVQSGLGLIDGNFYSISFDIVRTSGEITCLFGYPDPNQTQTIAITQTGSYTFDLFYLAGIGNESITFYTANNFTGSISNISVKLRTNTYWIPNGDWTLSDGQACHRVGGINDLDENVPNYIDANSYYKLVFTVSNRTDGAITVGMANVNTGSITTNGSFTYWLTPTANGVLTIAANSTFDGCISNIAVYKLRNDYSAELIDSNGTKYDVSNSFEYYQDYVTLGFSFDDYELADDCYTLNVYDQCIVTSDNLITNGDFALGFADWVKNNSGSQYAIIGDQLEMSFNPFGIGDTDYVTNGDFSGGATGWTLGAGWSIVGNAARHTAGNTATLSQTMTLPAPPLPATGFNYWVGFTISNWTTGTVTVKLGNAATGTTYTWKGNDRFIQFYGPKQSGSVDITFTPSSTFDGDIDDIKVVKTNHSGVALLYHTGIPTLTPGTYQTEWEIVGSTDLGISAKAYMNGVPTPSYQSAWGTYSFTQTYTLNGGTYYILVNFGKTDPNYIQPNYIEGSIIIDNVSLQKIEPFEATYASECLQYNSNGFARTKMLVGYCDQPSFGFEFANTGFRLQQRAEIRSIAPTYPKATTVMKSGTGNARVAYSEVEKYWQLHTGFASETFHDAMAAIISCDHFQIGDTEDVGVEYVAEAEDYSPNWQTDGSYSLATAVVNLRIKEKGQQFNRHI
jgi:hypothetical protein